MTKHMCDEMMNGDIKHVIQKKGLAEKENYSLVLAKEMHNTVLMKGVMHKGYWKYKPQHFIDQQTSIDSAGDRK